MSAPLHPTDERDPEISVLLVTYGAWEWTERCLAALFETTDVAYELICIDNASSDGSADRLAAMPGVRLVRNVVNLGYGVAANLAALRARAPYLLLLNTDAIVQPGWLPPLREVLDAEDDVAAVSARLLHLDGQLQEAGSVIWGDGTTDCYGDGDDPARPEYRFRRDVDYASAACLLVRRSAFLDAGGFDPAYQPAYYEDTDLAMRWRSRTSRVVYQPLSTAVHKRWASSENRAATEELVERHRPLFWRRWRGLIGTRPVRPASPDVRTITAVRDAECGERILGVVDALDSEAGGIAITVLLGLGGPQAPWRRSLLCPPEAAEGGAAETLRARGVEVVGTTDVPRWLSERRSHYSCLLVAEPSDALTERALRDSQPFAASALILNHDRATSDSGGWTLVAQVAIRGRQSELADPEAWSLPLPCVSLDQAGALATVAALTGLRSWPAGT